MAGVDLVCWCGQLRQGVLFRPDSKTHLSSSPFHLDELALDVLEGPDDKGLVVGPRVDLGRPALHDLVGLGIESSMDGVLLHGEHEYSSR